MNYGLRIATNKLNEIFGTDATEHISDIEYNEKGQRYQYDNHLGSACLELDGLGHIISYEEYHPFGTTSYRSGRSETEVSLKRYKYNGKERDEETGLYMYGMRYYAAWLCRFISTDPLKEKYPDISPYAYCANNPVKYIDPDGRKIVVGGQAKRQYYNQVREGAKSLGISIKMNKDGILSAKFKRKEEISADGQKFLNAVNSQKVTVKINTTNSDYVDGVPFVGGAFMGNEVTIVTRKIGKDDIITVGKTATAFQTVNPDDLEKMDNYSRKLGMTSIHEVTEPYQGALISIEKGISSGNEINDPNSVYTQAHDAATPQSMDLYRFYLNEEGRSVTKDTPEIKSVGWGFTKKIDSIFKETKIKNE